MTKLTNAVPEAFASACPQCNKPAFWAYRGVRDAWHLDNKEYAFARCGSCRSLFVFPPPTDDELAKSYAHAEYFTHFANAPCEAGERRSLIRRYLHQIRLDTFRVAFGYGRGSFLAETLAAFGKVRRRCGQSMRYLRWKQNGTLLEVGCGDGTFLREAHRWGWKCWGIEPDKQAVSHRLGEEGITVMCGRLEDIERLPVSGLRFDAIVLHHVIEHLRCSREALRVLRSITAPNGQIISISPNPEALGLDLAGRCWPGLDPPRHLMIPSARLLLQVCDELGLDATCFSLHRNLKSNFCASVRDRRKCKGLGWLTKLRFAAVALFSLALTVVGAGRGDEIVLVATRE